ncbi:MAG: hypothetical protein WBB45_08995 [Cyclobacteriaceae bacterium]
MFIIGGVYDPAIPATVLLVVNVPLIIVRYTYFNPKYRLKRHLRKAKYALPRKDKSGFTLVEGLNKSDYLWQDVRSIDIRNNLDLKVDTVYKKIAIPFKDAYSYFQFVRAIPEEKIKGGETRRVRVFDKLEDCRICGYQARIEEKCYECFSYMEEGYERAVEDTDNLKKLQLVYLADLEGSKEETPYDNSNPFEKDTGWKPLVSNKEVKAYRESDSL